MLKSNHIYYLIIMVLFTFPTLVQAIELKTEFQKSFPKYFIDQGKVVGLCMDVMQAVENKLTDVKFVGKIKFTPFKRIQKNLDDGKIDVFFGFAKNDARLKKYVFIDTPIYEVNHVVAVRVDDNVNVKNFDDIRKIEGDQRILTNTGTATERYLKKQGGLKIDAQGKTVSVNLKKLLKNRGRFVYFHNIGLVSTIKRDSLVGKIKVLPTSFRKYFHYVAFSKQVPKSTIKKIQTALMELTESGELSKIRAKYTSVN